MWRVGNGARFKEPTYARFACACGAGGAAERGDGDDSAMGSDGDSDSDDDIGEEGTAGNVYLRRFAWDWPALLMACVLS